MDDLFNFTEIRIRQPGKILPGRASYEIFGGRKELLAVATEVEARSVLHKITKLLPGTRALTVTTPAGESLFDLLLDSGEFVATLTGPDEEVAGVIRIGGSRRHYTLVNGAEQVLAEAVGDLAVRRFVVSGPSGAPTVVAGGGAGAGGRSGPVIGEIRKTFAGPMKEALTSADHYTVRFTAPDVPALTRTLTVFVPVVLDLARYGPS
ncbi:MAG TPA: hypothetical protein VH478_01360 [Trebonia sp.]|jgi:hypothetical protein|nr:hypothetical protein [Trebonia sp.]